MEVRGAAPVPPSQAGDQDDLRAGLRHARSDRAHARLADQLDGDPRGAVGVLEVVDQLREILDGVDVVVAAGGEISGTPGVDRRVCATHG